MFIKSAALALLLAAISVHPAAAQLDYRNLDAHRPTLTEDAYPIERYAWEIALPYHFEREAGGARTHALLPELVHAPLRNLHLGLGAPLALVDPDAGPSSEVELAGLGVHSLYNFFTEGVVLPALSLRADLKLPWGGLGGEATQVTLKAIATKSWGLARAHLNVARSFGDEDATPAAVEAAARWSASVAVDRTFFRQSALLLGEVYARRQSSGVPVEVTAALGTRYQVTPTLVLGLGLARRLRQEVGPDLAVNVGLSHAFGLRRLMPRGRSGPRRPTAGGTGLASRDEQFYYPGRFNWSFLDHYPEAAHLFNAFDYGHAILYEKLLTRPRDLVGELEERQFRYLTTDLLPNPPRFAVAEEAIEWRYARRNWRAKMMFDWAHVLHRQIYDAYADERLTPAARDTLIERLTDYYLSNTKYAFAAVPKSMALMDEQYYSQTFRRAYPKFNGVIWAYHWLQVGLYDPLIVGTTPMEKKTNIHAALARFWSMLEDAPRHMPRVMPMTVAISPRFAAAHPRAAIIFDNLHMMHDIISDILEADTVPAAEKSRVINGALDELQDSTRNVLTREEWLAMPEHMGGIEAMGGPATGILPAPARGDPGHLEH